MDYDIASSFKKARKILQILSDNGYTSYIAGGWVRDLLLDLPSDDIDIATEAPPEIVAQLFPKTLPVGTHFGCTIVIIDNTPFEVSMFRTDGVYADGRRPTQVAAATPASDAMRRDFTINGLFFDPFEKRIIDYVGGQKDIANRSLRCIGNPFDRFSEDYLRILRAVRFAARFQLTVDPHLIQAAHHLKGNIAKHVARERQLQELKKIILHDVTSGWNLLDAWGLLETLFSITKEQSTQLIQAPLPPLPPIGYLAPLLQTPSQWPLSKQERQFCSAYQTICAYLSHTPCNNDFFLMLFTQQWLDPFFSACYAAKNGDGVVWRTAWEKFANRHAIALERLRQGPFITANDLMAHGIAPGPQLGQLLAKVPPLVLRFPNHSKEALIQHLCHDV